MRLSRSTLAAVTTAMIASTSFADVPFQQLADFGRGGLPNDVNAQGTIVGGVRAADDSGSVPVVWDSPTATPVALPTVNGGSASAINSNGQIVGLENFPVGAGAKPVLWENGQAFILPDVGNGGYAYDINEAGVIVGSVVTEAGEYLACRWVNRQLELLPLPEFSAGDPSQQVWSFAQSINSAGVICGTIQGQLGTPALALRWTDANPDKVYRLQPFGGRMLESADIGGFTLPVRVELANQFGTPGHAPFFRARLASVSFGGPAPADLGPR